MSGRELPGERQEYLNDMLEEWENAEWTTPFPSTVRRRWQRGMFRQRAVEENKRINKETTDEKGGNPRREGLQIQDKPSNRRMLDHEERTPASVQ